MDNNFCIESPLLLKAKFDMWSDYTTISEIPRSFLELVKTFSSLLFPNNFSINYLDSKLNIHSIDSDRRYVTAILDCIQNKKQDLRLMITVYKDNKILNVDRSVIKRTSLIKYTDIIVEESDKNECEIQEDTCRKARRKRSSRKNSLQCC